MAKGHHKEEPLHGSQKTAKANNDNSSKLQFTVLLSRLLTLRVGNTHTQYETPLILALHHPSITHLTPTSHSRSSHL